MNYPSPNLSSKGRGKNYSQYQSATTHGGLFDFSYRGKIEVHGKNRVSFLHRMLTQDIESLKPGEGCHSCFLTAQAKIITDMNVLIFDQHILITVEPDYTQKTISALEKFVITEDVAFKNGTDEIAALAVFGPAAETLLQQMLAESSGGECVGFALPMRHFFHAAAKFEGEPIEMVRIPFYGTKGWVLLVPMVQKEKIWGSLILMGKALEITAIDHEIKEVLRIEAGIPACGVDFTEENLLLETGLESRAVSFTKGCYPGQEIVARMDSRAKFAKKLTGILVLDSGIPKSGERIEKAGKEIGKITSVCFSPKLNSPLALGYINRSERIINAEVEIVSGGKKLKARLLELPI